MKMNTTMIEMDYENHINEELTHNQAIGRIAREWGMTPEEVQNNKQVLEVYLTG